MQLLKIERKGGIELGSKVASVLVEAFGNRACYFATKVF